MRRRSLPREDRGAEAAAGGAARWVAQWVANGQMELHAVEDAVDEVFDMVKPAAAGRLTLPDLLASGMGSTVVAILADVGAFYAYENRESLAAAQEEEGRSAEGQDEDDGGGGPL